MVNESRHHNNWRILTLTVRLVPYTISRSIKQNNSIIMMIIQIYYNY